MSKKVRGKDGSKYAPNAKVRMEYELCSITEIYATCMVVRPEVPRTSLMADTQIQVTAEMATLNGGSLKINHLGGVFKINDKIEVNAFLRKENLVEDEDADLVEENREWCVTDIRPATRHGSPIQEENVMHAVVKFIDESRIGLLSRVGNCYIHGDPYCYGTGHKDGELVAVAINQTVLVRFRQKRGLDARAVRARRLDSENPAFEGIAIEPLPRIKDDGVLYFIREEYTVILRMSPEEELMAHDLGGRPDGDRLEFRYVYAPSHLIDAYKTPMEDWFGRRVTFLAVEDQPGGDDDRIAPRWRVLSAQIQPSSTRGPFKFRGIWHPKEDEFSAHVQRRHRANPIQHQDNPRTSSPSEDSDMMVPEAVVNEWKEGCVRIPSPPAVAAARPSSVAVADAKKTRAVSRRSQSPPSNRSESQTPTQARASLPTRGDALALSVDMMEILTTLAPHVPQQNLLKVLKKYRVEERVV